MSVGTNTISPGSNTGLYSIFPPLVAAAKLTFIGLPFIPPV